MCYYLCLAVEKDIANVERSFGSQVKLEPIVGAPLARAAVDDPDTQQAYLVTLQGCSCDLLHGGHRLAGNPRLVLDGLTQLLSRAGSAALLSHWFTQPPAEGQVERSKEEKISLSKLKKLFPDLEEDVRYVVRA